MQFPLTFYSIHAHKTQTQKKTLKKLFYSKDREATHIKKWNCSIKWERYLMWNIRHNYLGFGKLSTIRHKALKDTTAQTTKKNGRCLIICHGISLALSAEKHLGYSSLIETHKSAAKPACCCTYTVVILFGWRSKGTLRIHVTEFSSYLFLMLLYDTITYVALFSVFLFFFYTFVCWCFEYFFVVCEKKMLLFFFF